MDVAGRRPPPTVRLRRLAAELRSLRDQAGLTRQEAAERVDVNQTTLWKIETAKARPQRRTLNALLDLYGVTDTQERAALLDLTNQASQRGWLQTYDDELPPVYQTYMSFEAEASGVRNYESSFVPGLLQTEDYARAVIRGVLPLASDEEVQARVEARMQRQERVRSKTLKLWAIIDEAVIRRRVGNPKITAAQLRALVEASQQTHITLQVIPFVNGPHPGMPGSFVVMDFPDAADQALVYTDSMAGDLLLERDTDVRRYAAIFEHLRATALDLTNSVEMIAEAAAVQ